MLQRRFKPRLVSWPPRHGGEAQGVFEGLGLGQQQPDARKPARPQVGAPAKPQIVPAPVATPVRDVFEVQKDIQTEDIQTEKEQQIARLRAALFKLEKGHGAQDLHDQVCEPAGLSLGDLDRHLPAQGLPVGVLNEITADYVHRPAAFGFTFALMALGQKRRAGPVILVMSQRALRDFGHPYGHGLAQLGLDVGELILVEAGKDIDALWAIEEALRARGSVALVAGAITSSIDLTAARRLNLAAASTGTPLVVLRTGKADTGPAATRWRIETAPAQRDPYGGFGRWRWHAHLERCRNGRPRRWTIEWCHVAHRFHMVESVADRALAAQPGGTRRAG